MHGYRPVERWELQFAPRRASPPLPSISARKGNPAVSDSWSPPFKIASPRPGEGCLVNYAGQEPRGEALDHMSRRCTPLTHSCTCRSPATGGDEIPDILACASPTSRIGSEEHSPLATNRKTAEVSH